MGLYSIMGATRLDEPLAHSSQTRILDHIEAHLQEDIPFLSGFSAARTLLLLLATHPRRLLSHRPPLLLLRTSPPHHLLPHLPPQPGTEQIHKRHPAPKAVHERRGVEEIGVARACDEPEVVQEREKDERVQVDARREERVAEVFREAAQSEASEPCKTEGEEGDAPLQSSGKQPMRPIHSPASPSVGYDLKVEMMPAISVITRRGWDLRRRQSEPKLFAR